MAHSTMPGFPVRLWTKDAAPAVGLRPQTLRKLRVSGGGPKFRYENRKVYYLERDLREWVEGRRAFSSTAERRAAERSENKASRPLQRTAPRKAKRMNVQNSAGAECTSSEAGREGSPRGR